MWGGEIIFWGEHGFTDSSASPTVGKTRGEQVVPSAELTVAVPVQVVRGKHPKEINIVAENTVSECMTPG